MTHRQLFCDDEYKEQSFLQDYGALVHATVGRSDAILGKDFHILAQGIQIQLLA